jgi:uncharacterized membrane protein
MPENVKIPILPAHVEDTVQAIARLHAEHYEKATPFQKTIDGLTARTGRPEFVGILTVLVLGWMAANVIFPHLGYPPLDEPPFPWMQGAIGLSALYMTMLILITQRREDKLASHREQLTLELGILSEQKSAKIIELLEELRRDAPDLRNRVDPEATAMATPADPQEVLDAIKETHEKGKANEQGTAL